MMAKVSIAPNGSKKDEYIRKNNKMRRNEMKWNEMKWENSNNKHAYQFERIIKSNEEYTYNSNKHKLIK